jgi:hypothetical protein
LGGEAGGFRVLGDEAGGFRVFGDEAGGRAWFQELRGRQFFGVALGDLSPKRWHVGMMTEKDSVACLCPSQSFL